MLKFGTKNHQNACYQTNKEGNMLGNLLFNESSKKGFTLAEGATHVDTYANNRENLLILEEGATHVDTSQNLRKFGFTLAEVLITLAVIGVVAAMTLPQMIQNYQKKVMANKLKKFYSTMTQAIKRSEFDNAEIKYWYELDDIGGSCRKADNVAEKYLLPYLKVVNVLSSNKNLVSWQALNGETSGSAMTGNGNGLFGNYYVLSDGTILRFSAGRGIRVYVDLNGVKRPNTYGKDVFIFTTSNGSSTRSGYKFIPGSYDQFGNGNWDDEKTREYLLTRNSKSGSCSSTIGWGWACAALIMKDGWEIKPDYPW